MMDGAGMIQAAVVRADLAVCAALPVLCAVTSLAALVAVILWRRRRESE